MKIQISKSQFKPKALEYLRLVEEKGTSIIITHNKKPTVIVSPIDNDEAILSDLGGSVLEYKEPLDPVGIDDWEALK